MVVFAEIQAGQIYPGNEGSAASGEPAPSMRNVTEGGNNDRRSTSSGLAVSIRTTSRDGAKSGTEVARLLITDTLGYLEDR